MLAQFTDYDALIHSCLRVHLCFHMQDPRVHFDSISDLLDQLLCLPSLEALQVVAIQSNMAVNLGRAHHAGLTHLALACRSLVMLTGGGSRGLPFDSPQSLHLLLRVRTLSLFCLTMDRTVTQDSRGTHDQDVCLIRPSNQVHQ